MSFYTDIAKTATSIITQFGQTITITRSATGEYDPHKAETTGAPRVPEVVQTGKGCIFDYGSKDIDGTLIRQGDKQCLLSVESITEPELDDLITFGGKNYVIKNIKTLSPAGTNLIYDLNIRGA